MLLHTLSESSFVLYIDKNELAGQEIALQDVNMESAERLLAYALGDRAPGGEARIDVFSGEDSLLLFARFYHLADSWLLFDSFEDLIDAAKLCEEGIDSTLVWSGGFYILGTNERIISSALTEYAQPITLTYALHLTEQGKILIENNALDIIKKTF